MTVETRTNGVFDLLPVTVAASIAAQNEIHTVESRIGSTFSRRVVSRLLLSESREPLEEE